MTPDLNIINIDEYDPEQLKGLEILRTHGNSKQQKRYINIISAFDIETTNLPDIPQNVMYIWQMQIGKDTTIVGRYWFEFFQLLQKIRKQVQKNTMVIYVHNLSYEFQYLKGLYHFEPDEVFCTDSRKVLKCTMFDCFEFRCSYFLTNCSLQQFTYQMQVKDKKLSGLEFDYLKIRYPWTPLTERELEYCVNDVRGLVEALYKKLDITGDNVLTVPLTQTGYVRRRCREAMKGYNHDQLHEMLPDPDVYRLLREAFRGGNTHANRYYVGQIVNNVKSLDIVSSYPAVMLQCLYPMSKFYPVPDCSLDNILSIMKEHKQAIIMRIAFRNIDLKNIMIGCPYLSRDKCRNIINGVFDNGRILRASYLETTITDVDLRIILDCYKWDGSDIWDAYTAYYKPLPSMLLDVVREFYTVKTTLKGVSEDSDEYFQYMLNKEMLNSCYGMTAQDPVKDSIEFIAEADDSYQEKDEPLEKLLNESNKKAFLSYAWGTWVTCWARYRLQQAIDLASDNFVYCDTDSVKYTGELDLTAFNNERIKECLNTNAYAVDRKGEVHYMGVFEDDGSYKQFSTLGAKKYVYTDMNDKLHITIAGVNKKLGPVELGKIENFKEGFTFYKAGGTESTFNDNVRMTVTEEGHPLEITDNIVIKNGMYTLGITQEFKDILFGLVKIRYADHEIKGLYKYKK